MVKNLPAMQETCVQSLGWEDSPGGGHGNPLQYSWTSLVAPKVKNLPANAGDLASSSRLGRSHRESIVKLETKYFRGNLKKYQNWTSSKTGISDTELVYEFKDNHLQYISLSLSVSLCFLKYLFIWLYQVLATGLPGKLQDGFLNIFILCWMSWGSSLC